MSTPPQFPVPERLPRFPPTLKDWKLWVALFGGYVMVGWNLFAAHFNAARGETLLLAIDCICLAGCFLAATSLTRTVGRYWREWNRVRVRLEALVVEIEACNARIRRGEAP